MQGSERSVNFGGKAKTQCSRKGQSVRPFPLRMSGISRLLCVLTQKTTIKKESERERVGRRCKSKDYKDTGRENENTRMDDLTKTGWSHTAPYVPG